MYKHTYGNYGMEVRSERKIASNMPSRRLEDRIRSLCADVVGTGEQDHFERAISKLQSALREHNQRLRNLAVAKLTRLWSSPDKSETFGERSRNQRSN
jgi:hypothetical protein